MLFSTKYGGMLDRTSDSQSRDPGLNSLSSISKLGQFLSLLFSCINKYLAIDSCGYI